MRAVRPWKRRSAEQVFQHALFSLEIQTVEASNGDERRALVIHPTDWVNIIAIGDDDAVALVRQWRFGTAAESLEIPGGMVDPGEGPLAAAQRELLEETGYRAAEWTPLGVVDPNPAFLSNRCWMFLATSLEKVGEAQGDGKEEISLEWASIDDIPAMFDSGRISHSLVVSAFYFYERWKNR